MRRSLLPLLTVVATVAGTIAAQDRITIGSKNFTESRILAEMLAQLVEAHTDLQVERRLGLGGTLICFQALRQGDLDVYPDYTGTGWAIVLKRRDRATDPLRTYTTVAQHYESEYGVRWLQPLGLNNTYALAMREVDAERLQVETLSDLRAHRELRAGFSLEFMNREDGWPGLRAAYGLEFGEVRGMEHGLAYAAIESGEVDLIDAYSTDGKLLKYRLRVLSDDRGFFPPYQAAPLVRADTLRRHPNLLGVLDQLAYRLPDAVIQKLNFAVEEEGKAFATVAHEFLREEGLLAENAMAPLATTRDVGFLGLMAARSGRTLVLAGQHLLLTLTAVLLATLVGVPLGIACVRRPTLRRIVLGGAGVVQTIPSLALLAFMIPIPWLGLSASAAIAALFLYSLLPILRNTYTGIVGVPPELIEAARGMGMYERQVLRLVQMPLAMRTIMAGLRTATVVGIGVATLAAFIGAGGLGEPIVTGLQLNDTNLILTGAVPAALLALLVDGALGWAERWVTPRGA
ncbi:MAG: glycine betaine ABC transporter substrate-binding protein [Planctomycetota bacterium]